MKTFAEPAPASAPAIQKSSASREEAFARILGALALVLGTVAAIIYARAGLTLSHYDAKAHLVVARRVLDSLTPEWSQLGAVWLPLPHLLNVLPAQIDGFYRTGASAVAISVLSFGVMCYAAARLILQVTGSRVGALVGVALLALDPNLLYLQATPMTEPLLFGLTLLAVAQIHDWMTVDAARPPRAAGWTLAAACLTRYEAWFVTAAAIGLAGLALWRRGLTARQSCRAAFRLAAYPAITIAAFIAHSRYTTGEWFVTDGFFVPDNPARGHLYDAFLQVTWGVRTIAGNGFALLAAVGVGILAQQGLRERQRASQLMTLSLLAFMALPSYAFFEGHPFRMRYTIAPVVAAAVFCGMAVGWLRGRWRTATAVAVCVGLVMSAKPFDRTAPIVLEAQWDLPNSVARRTVTACLMRDYRGEPILVSMGSLAHYMQELSQEGLNIRDFVHEGNKPFWPEALEDPNGHVGWILIEEQAEGGDVLSARAKESPAFLDGFRRICGGGGVALYQAVDHAPSR